MNKRLKNLRESRGWSMRETAKRIGIPETTYCEWEYGRAIRGEPYAKIAKAFGVSIESLFGQSCDEITLEQRLIRAKEDIEFVQSQIAKTNQK